VAVFYKTINAGTDWTAQTSGTTNSLYTVCFASATMGYCVGDNGTILKRLMVVQIG